MKKFILVLSAVFISPYSSAYEEAIYRQRVCLYDSYDGGLLSRGISNEIKSRQKSLTQEEGASFSNDYKSRKAFKPSTLSHLDQIILSYALLGNSGEVMKHAEMAHAVCLNSPSTDQLNCKDYEEIKTKPQDFVSLTQDQYKWMEKADFFKRQKKYKKDRVELVNLSQSGHKKEKYYKKLLNDLEKSHDKRQRNCAKKAPLDSDESRDPGFSRTRGENKSKNKNKK